MEPTSHRTSIGFLMLLFAAGLLVGGFVTFYISYVEVNSLRDDVNALQSQISGINGSQNITNQDITVYQNSTALTTIYSNVLLPPLHPGQCATIDPSVSFKIAMNFPCKS